MNAKITGFFERVALKENRFKKPLTAVFAIALLFALSSASAFAQKAEIKGKVLDLATGKPLVGATVSIPSLRLGAITGKNGEFSFKAPAGTHTLRVKFIGYDDISMKVTVKGGETKNLTLKMKTGGVTTDEIVVVGLSGEVNRNELGNTIATVPGKEIAKVVSTSPLDALSGQVAGMQVTRNSGTPGAGTYITIRGRRTISGSSEPLYVVDGIILDNSSLYDPSGTVQYSNRAVDINPQDIESIEVLKGAAAAAIYGSQAANGVILITTKKGQMSTPDHPARVTFSTSYEVDQKYGEVPLQTIYGQGLNGIHYEPGTTNYSYGPRLDTIGSPKIYDHCSEPFRTGLSNVQSLSISGGVPQFDYLVNGTYEGIQGYVEGSEYERTSIRANLGFTIAPGLTLQSNSNFISINNDLPQDGSNVSGILLGALRTPPEVNNKIYLNPDGSQRRFGYYDNPIWTEKMNTFNSKIERYLQSANLKWKPYSWFTFDTRFGMDRYEYINTERLAVGSASSDNREGYIAHQRITNRQMNLDVTGTFQYAFLDNDLQTTLVLGNQIIWYKSYSDAVDASKTLPFYDQISAGVTKDGSSSLYESKTVGLFAQLTATLWDRISLTAAIRRDGKSTFGESQKFHYYPKAGLSYTLTDEPFMEDYKDVVNNIRFRASYGEAGSPDLPGIYATNFLYGTGGFFSPWGRDSKANRAGYIGIRNGGLPAGYSVVAGAKDIAPELTIEREIGVDLGFLNDRFGLEFTYYYFNTFDMILDVPVAPSTGFDMELRNIGAMQSDGIELTLRATPVMTDDFVWNSTFMYSSHHNKVTSLPGVDFVSLSGGFVGIQNVAIEGEELGVFRGYGWLRDDNGNVVFAGEETTINGKKVVPEDYMGFPFLHTPVESDNLQIIGNPNPKFLLSWRNEFTLFKDFSLSFLIDGAFDFDVWNGTKGALYNFGTHGDTKDRDEPWINMEGTPVVDTDGNPVPNLYKYRFYYNGFFINEPHIEDGTFIKLREVNLEYRFRGLEDWNISSLVLTFSARNLLTITDYTGFDPEVNTFALAEGRGFDYFTLPQMTSFRFGLSIVY